ncbi:MAG: CoB--CoM heterodisulfide reductase iron-sulfur subunit B family protein [Thermodesulfobacteriota bacterium]|nr:CoB--CoM heterodisulfide reductase iron-sulfur subunit B family protein [Thermodesulfobacteriota bacterium]
MSTYGYYPGCSSHGTAREYETSAQLVLKALKLDMKEVSDWNCCGASAAHVTSEELAIALPHRNLVLAEKQGFSHIVTTCAACFNRLKIANKTLKEEQNILARMEEISGTEYSKTVAVHHILEVFYHEVGIERLKAMVIRPLSDLRVASYYGCLLTRPKHITIDKDYENPTIMDEIVSATGALPVEWSHKTECCGASLALGRTDIVHRLCKEIFEAALLSSSDVIVVACPLCHSNLDMRQSQINTRYHTHFDIPIVFITQLLGLAFGKGFKELEMGKPLVSSYPILKEKKIL